MNFQVAARTLLHLGAELISSDSIALYELIKNAYDARSHNVKIEIEIRLPHRVQRKLLRAIAEWTAQDPKKRPRESEFVSNLKGEFIGDLDLSSADATRFRKRMADAGSAEDARRVIRDTNRIVVSDTGIGMSLEELGEAFLTIGTRIKQQHKKRQVEAGETVLGEKGIGRLSAMRLGKQLTVKTTKVGNPAWSILEIDWSAFSHDSDAMLSDISVAPRPGPPKSVRSVSGTQIIIGELNRDWSIARTTQIAQDFSKVNDPFEPQKRFPIGLYFNGEVVPIPTISRILLRAAHATGRGAFKRLADGTYVLSGDFAYRGKTEVFSFARESLHSLTEESDPDVFKRIGPFQFEFYWYNRRYLSAVDGIGDLHQVRQQLSEWSGGLMLYRDSFRVLPYGGSYDDWLKLDRRALSRSGFKVNRTQLVGRVNISYRDNPHLVDQSNREGLRDNEEKRAFVEMLSYVLQQAFWSFLERVDKEGRRALEPAAVEDVEGRLEHEEDRISQNLRELVQRVPELKKHGAVLTEIREALESLRSIMTEVRHLTDQYEEGRGQLLNLAGVGLTVEILAHEINRATSHALQTLARLPDTDLPADVETMLSMLGAQLKALQKRLRILDPLSTSGRNRKERFDVVELVRDVLTSHGEQFAREGIEAKLEIVPKSPGKLPIRSRG